MNFNIKQAQYSDLPIIADIHINELKGDLLPFFGKVFLCEYFYPLLLKSNECDIYVVSHDGEISGFMVMDITGRGVQKVTSCLYKELITLGLMNIFGLIKFIPQIISMFISSRQSGEIMEIAFIAIKYNLQGQGIGKYMVNHVIELLSLPCVVKTSKNSAKHFYEKLGFIPIGKEYRGLRCLNVLRHY